MREFISNIEAKVFISNSDKRNRNDKGYSSHEVLALLIPMPLNAIVNKILLGIVQISSKISK